MITRLTLVALAFCFFLVLTVDTLRQMGRQHRCQREGGTWSHDTHRCVRPFGRPASTPKDSHP